RRRAVIPQGDRGAQAPGRRQCAPGRIIDAIAVALCGCDATPTARPSLFWVSTAPSRSGLASIASMKGPGAGSAGSLTRASFVDPDLFFQSREVVAADGPEPRRRTHERDK